MPPEPVTFARSQMSNWIPPFIFNNNFTLLSLILLLLLLLLLFQTIISDKCFQTFFETINVLYIDINSHNSGNFLNLYMPLIWVNWCPLSSRLSFHNCIPIGKGWFIYKYIFMKIHMRTNKNIPNLLNSK